MRLKTAKRNASAMTLIEMLSAIFIMSFVAAAMCELAVTQNYVSFRAFNRTSSVLEATRFQTQLEHEIHMARFIGSQYGDTIGPLNGANSFPGQQDPLYGSAGTPPSAFSGYPTITANSTWPNQPYYLNPQTLIIQVPIFDQDGFPTGDGIGHWNVDTYVYEILADNSKAGLGQFVLQKTIFPGSHSNLFTVPPATWVPKIPSNAPQTLVSGIVGPINPQGTPDPVAGTPPPLVFSYFTNSTYGGNVTPTIQSPSAAQVAGAGSSAGISGVSINLEVFTGEKAENSNLMPQTVPLHCEFFTRSNLVSRP